MRLPGRSSGPVTAAFAEVLDGLALWLAVPLDEVEEGSSFGLRDESGVTAHLGGEIQGRWLAVIADLPTTPGSYDVLVTRDDDVRAVVAEPPTPGPTRTPDGGPVRFALEHDETGLRITVTALDDTADVIELGTDGTTITFTVTGAGERLVFVQDRVDLGSVPLVPGPRGLTASLTAADAPGSNMRLVVVDGERRRQVRRLHNGLTAAGPSVLLPRLEDDDGEPTLVCLWHPDSGNLRLRRPQAAAAAEPA